jgi:hypothetical protein
MNEGLMREFSRDEVTTAVQQMSPHKAPDSMNFLLVFTFYQDNWEELGEEVCQSVLEIFNSGTIDKELNFTYIVLISKTANPERVSKFSAYKSLYCLV